MLLRWVAANAFDELFSLNLTAATIGLTFSCLGEAQTAGMILASFLLAVAGGGIEATMVSLAQW
jgi:hypothetical protein